MTSRVWLACWAVALAVGSACQEDTERPPAAPPCTSGSKCGGPPISGRTPPSGEGGADSGEGGAAGEAAGGEIQRAELAGTIRELVDDRFSASTPFTEQATVEAEGESGGIVRASWTGIGEFRLRDFEQVPTLWVRVDPEPNVGVLPTMHPVDLHTFGDDEPVALGLVREDAQAVVFASLAAATEPLASRAQVVLIFRDRARGRGVAGVQVALSSAEFVTYGRGGTWSELETATDEEGVVWLGNVVAAPFPGTTERVSLGGTLTGRVHVRVARGTVSLVEVVVP